MLRAVCKILVSIFLIVCVAHQAAAQKTFYIEKAYLDSFDFGRYKSYVVSKNNELNFIGRKVPLEMRFTPDTAQIAAAEHAIKTQYYKARVQQLDSQWMQMERFRDAYDWEVAVKQREESRPKMLAAFKKQQQKELEKYDRYYYGYVNEDGEPIVLIQFDPHKIKYFTIAGERHISNLPTLVYNTKTQKLSLSGWE
ncbi:MAG TPA: hypothetical protein VD794_12305 [Flavisolibacter sp.]|nr:hypothetical protein [Flavisolibacter sp.]